VSGQNPEAISRRRFMSRMAKAGATIAAAGTLSYLLYEREAPTGREGEAADIVLPDYSIESLRGKMAVAHGSDRAKSLTTALAAVGGIGAFVTKGDRVMLKVNAAFATPPLLSATTHPDLVSEMVRQCFAAGAAEVRVTDNPINDPDTCFRLTGIAEAAEKAGAKVFVPRPEHFKPITVEGASLIREWPLLYRPLEGITKMIGMAPVKDHHRSGASMTMKNWYGLLGGRRNVFHQDINTIIRDLALMVRPTLVVLDGTTTMMSNGPTGGSVNDLKQTDTLIVSTDQVAADARGVALLDRSTGDLPYIQMAADAGLGTSDYASLKAAEV
jgi:uncharacterized protein (DUF362 family)